MKRVLITMAVILAIFANINLQAASEPCTGTHLPGCDWETVKYKEIILECCPTCPVVVEYYIKDCDGNFAIQITAVYKKRFENGYDNMICSTAYDLEDIVHECYRELIKYYHVAYPDPDRTYFMQQKSCYKTWGFMLTNFGTIDIPVLAFVARNPEAYPVDPNNPSIVVLQYMSGWEVCESSCCCYEVAAYWNLSTLSAIYVEAPCGINEDYECPTGCIGGCEDMLFSWSAAQGWVDPDNPNGKRAINTNEFENQISIVPNPNKGSFKISYTDGTTGNLTIKLTDINGKILQTYNFDKKTGEFSNDFVINDNNGTYILLFELNGNYLGSSKIMINK